MIAESFDEAHRCALVGVGVLPLQYIDGQNASSLGLSGKEAFTIELNDGVSLNELVAVKVRKLSRRSCTVAVLFVVEHFGIEHFD